MTKRAVRSLRRVLKPQPFDVVVYYGQSLPTLLALTVRCFRGPVLVTYVVEWPKAVPRQSRLSHWNAMGFSALVFRLSAGAVVISAFLERQACSKRRSIPILRVPILCDPKSWEGRDRSVPAPAVPIITYCADLDGYLDDALLVVDIVGALDRPATLRLIGRASNATRSLLQQAGAPYRHNLELQFAQSLSDEALQDAYLSSSVLLLPLDDSERSQARFPIKLADYLLSERPVVTTRHGEPGQLLRDGVDAYLAEHATVNELSTRLSAALDDPASGDVGRCGGRTARSKLDYQLHGLRLARFLRDVVGGSQR